MGLPAKGVLQALFVTKRDSRAMRHLTTVATVPSGSASLRRSSAETNMTVDTILMCSTWPCLNPETTRAEKQSSRDARHEVLQLPWSFRYRKLQYQKRAAVSQGSILQRCSFISCSRAGPRKLDVGQAEFPSNPRLSDTFLCHRDGRTVRCG